MWENYLSKGTILNLEETPPSGVATDAPAPAAAAAPPAPGGAPAAGGVDPAVAAFLSALQKNPALAQQLLQAPEMQQAQQGAGQTANTQAALQQQAQPGNVAPKGMVGQGLEKAAGAAGRLVGQAVQGLSLIHI